MEKSKNGLVNTSLFYPICLEGPKSRAGEGRSRDLKEEKSLAGDLFNWISPENRSGFLRLSKICLCFIFMAISSEIGIGAVLSIGVRGGSPQFSSTSIDGGAGGFVRVIAGLPVDAGSGTEIIPGKSSVHLNGGTAEYGTVYGTIYVQGAVTIKVNGNFLGKIIGTNSANITFFCNGSCAGSIYAEPYVDGSSVYGPSGQALPGGTVTAFIADRFADINVLAYGGDATSGGRGGEGGTIEASWWPAPISGNSFTGQSKGGNGGDGYDPYYPQCDGGAGGNGGKILLTNHLAGDVYLSAGGGNGGAGGDGPIGFPGFNGGKGGNGGCITISSRAFLTGIKRVDAGGGNGGNGGWGDSESIYTSGVAQNGGKGGDGGQAGGIVAGGTFGIQPIPNFTDNDGGNGGNGGNAGSFRNRPPAVGGDGGKGGDGLSWDPYSKAGNGGTSGYGGEPGAPGSPGIMAANPPCPQNPECSKILIFVPGIAGSELREHAGVAWTDDPVLWPTIERANVDKLINNQRVYASDVARTAKVRDFVFGATIKEVDIYGGLITFLTTTAGYTEFDSRGRPFEKRTRSALSNAQPPSGPVLFLFPYDWRASNAESAEDFKSFVDGIRSIYPECPIDVLAHSMGGLVVTRYLVKYKSEKALRRIATIDTPFLGTPLALVRMLKGGFFDAWLIDARLNHSVRNLLKSSKSTFELMPSPTYFALASGQGFPLHGNWPCWSPVFEELNFDFNQNGTTKFPDDYTYAELMSTMAWKANHAEWESINADFHSDAQDDFSGDKIPNEWLQFVGLRSKPDSPIGLAAQVRRIGFDGEGEVSELLTPRLGFGSQTVSFLSTFRTASLWSRNSRNMWD